MAFRRLELQPERKLYSAVDGRVAIDREYAVAAGVCRCVGLSQLSQSRARPVGERSIAGAVDEVRVVGDVEHVRLEDQLGSLMRAGGDSKAATQADVQLVVGRLEETGQRSRAGQSAELVCRSRHKCCGIQHLDLAQVVLGEGQRDGLLSVAVVVGIEDGLAG